MSSPAERTLSFGAVAPRVLRWVWLRQWVALLGRTVWFASGWVVLLVVLGSAWRSVPIALLWASLVLWMVGAAVVVWRRRPREYGAFSLWDQAKDRREAFAAAWWFEQRSPARTAGEETHVAGHLGALGEALPRLRKDLPLRPHRFLWVPPSLVLLASVLSIGLAWQPAEMLVDEGELHKAKLEAERLAKAVTESKNLEGLKPEEQNELERLQASLKQTAQDLEKSGGKAAREVMADLERRAREAEKLAQRLGAGEELWASEKLVRALRIQADTADLGDALAAKDAAQGAAVAEKLSETLKSPQLTHDARERWTETLKDARKQAEAEDRQRLAGQHVLGAADRLEQQRADEAGAEFEKLAEKLRDAARREQTRKELEKLAQQLRDAGSNMAGQNQGGGMQQMQAGSQGQAGQQGRAPQVGQSQPRQGGQGQQALQPPGLGQMGQGQQQMMTMTPVPGTGQAQQMLMQQGAQGQGQQGQGQPMLLAPIPGAKPGEQPTAFLLGPPGQNPEDGPALAMAAPGGLQAGHGTAELKAEATGATKSGREAVVAPTQGNEGESTVRSVEGGARQERAGRSATEVAMEALAAEEEALDEAALPPGRREQVRRYFTELRQRFEKQ